MSKRARACSGAEHETAPVKIHKQEQNDADVPDPINQVKIEPKLIKGLRKKNISKSNNRFYKSLQKKCASWLKSTEPYEPSFCLFYLEDGKEIVWDGPQHMRGFAQHESVEQLFKETALKRNVFLECDESPKAVDPLIKDPILLKFKDPRSYSNDVLAKIVPRILNPHGKRNFYFEVNKPEWFPSDVVFRRPNHPKEGEKRMSAEEMSKVLKSFMIHCPQSYKIISDKLDDDSDEDPSSKDIPVDDGGKQKTKITTPKDALNWCSSASSFEEFKERALAVCSNIDTLSSPARATTASIDDTMIDWRRKHMLRDHLPTNLTPVLTSSMGDCLFGTISVCLFGNTESETLLRFAALIHGITHYDHYLEMLTEKIESISDAVQFLSTVVSCENILDQYPFESHTPAQVIEYTLTSEIQATAKIGSYSGLIQVLLLAGATGYAIQQHSEVNRDGYNTLIFPCPCFGTPKSTIHIMWVKSNCHSRIMNHIIPLLPESTEATSRSDGDTLSFIQNVISYDEICRFCATTAREKVGKEDMVLCDHCQAWYHCSCIGIASVYYDGTSIPFYCCQPPSDHLNFLVIKAQKEKKVVELKVSDIQSLYPNKGISDAVIDFYVRIMSPVALTNYTAGALAYTAISGDSTMKEIRRRFTNTNGAFSIQHPLLLFPCRPKDTWHWILVAVYAKEQLALVLDSASCGSLLPYAVDVVKRINLLLQCWPSLTGTELKPVLYQTPQQRGGEDCGIHVIHDILTITKHEKYALLDGTIDNHEFEVNAAYVRKRILKECEKRSRKISRVQILQISQEVKHKIDVDKLLSKSEDGLSIIPIEGKGRGVVATKNFKKDDMLCEYTGECILLKEAKRREKEYLKQVGIGCFMYYFTFNQSKLCIDSTKDDGHIGRMFNHSKKKPNVVTKAVDINGQPHLGLMAARDIVTDEELLYNYGERSKEVIDAFPWLLE